MFGCLINLELKLKLNLSVLDYNYKITFHNSESRPSVLAVNAIPIISKQYIGIVTHFQY